MLVEWREKVGIRCCMQVDQKEKNRTTMVDIGRKEGKDGNMVVCTSRMEHKYGDRMVCAGRMQREYKDRKGYRENEGERWDRTVWASRKVA